MTARVLRMSGLDRAAVCPASAAYDIDALRVEVEAAALGTAWHQAAAEHVAGASPDARRRAEIARAHEVAAHDLEELWTLGEPSLPAVGEGLAETEVREEIGGIALVGHVDWIGPVQEVVADWETGDGLVLSSGTRWARVRDWKTGRPPATSAERPLERWVQGHLYAVAVRRMLGIDAVLLERHWVRLGADGIEGRWLAGERWEETQRWLDGVVTRALDALRAVPEERVYRPRDTWTVCRGCAGRGVCPAYRQRLEDVGGLLGLPLEDLDAAKVRALWPRLQWWASLRTAVQDARRAVAQYLAEHGPVPLEDGIVLDVQRTARGGVYPVARKETENDREAHAGTAGDLPF